MVLQRGARAFIFSPSCLTQPVTLSFDSIRTNNIEHEGGIESEKVSNPVPVSVKIIQQSLSNFNCPNSAVVILQGKGIFFVYFWSIRTQAQAQAQAQPTTREKLQFLQHVYISATNQKALHARPPNFVEVTFPQTTYLQKSLPTTSSTDINLQNVLQYFAQLIQRALH